MWWRSRWGRNAARTYIFLLSAVAGYLTYYRLFGPARVFPGTLLLSLGLPWTRTIGGMLDPAMGRGAWPLLLVSFAANTAMLYFIGSRLELLARQRG